MTEFWKYLLGRTFVLLINCRSLVNLLSQDNPILSIAANHIQHWAQTLSAYSYMIKYHKGSLHASANACSHLSLKINHADPPESMLLIRQLDDSPVTRHLIATEIKKCSDLSMLKSYFLKGFSKRIPKKSSPFWKVTDESSILDDIILWDSCVFISPKFRANISAKLHSAHYGSSAIKLLVDSMCGGLEKIVISKQN